MALAPQPVLDGLRHNYFPVRLYTLRTRLLHLTQEKMGEVLGMRASSVCDIERAANPPSQQTQRLVDLLILCHTKRFSLEMLLRELKERAESTEYDIPN